MFLLVTAALARPLQDANLDLDGSVVLTPGDLTNTLGIRATGERNGYAGALWRLRASGDQVLRADAGVDILGGWERIDLYLGAAMAGAGDWKERALYPSVGAGLELGFGLNWREAHLRYMSVRPFTSSPASAGLKEDEWRLSWDVTDRLGVYGSALQLVPDLEKEVSVWSYGLGATWRI
jgi:hypothetical protein